MFHAPIGFDLGFILNHWSWKAVIFVPYFRTPIITHTISIKCRLYRKACMTSSFGCTISFSFDIDYALYRKFWELQDFFRFPSQCYSKLRWKVFTTVCSRQPLKSLSLCRTELHSLCIPVFQRRLEHLHQFQAGWVPGTKIVRRREGEASVFRRVLPEVLDPSEPAATSTERFQLQALHPDSVHGPVSILEICRQVQGVRNLSYQQLFIRYHPRSMPCSPPGTPMS